MAQLGRPGRTATVKEILWARWKAGESVTEISRAMSVGAKSVRRVLSSNGGCFPRPKKRSSLTLPRFRGYPNERAFSLIEMSTKRRQAQEHSIENAKTIEMMRAIVTAFGWRREKVIVVLIARPSSWPSRERR